MSDNIMIIEMKTHCRRCGKIKTFKAYNEEDIEDLMYELRSIVSLKLCDDCKIKLKFLGDYLEKERRKAINDFYNGGIEKGVNE